MKKLLAFFMTAMTFFMQFHVFAFESETNSIKSTGEYLIRFNFEKDTQQALFTNDNFDTKENIENILKANLSDEASVIVKDEITQKRSGKKTQLVSVTEKTDAEVIAQLREIDGVEYVEPNYKIEAFNDPAFGQQWALTNSSPYHINIDAAWNITKGNPDIMVAVIDSGIDINHPDLVDSIYTSPTETENGADTDGNGFKDDVHGWDFTTYVNSTQNGDNSVYDDPKIDEHGTHVAGIIAASHNNIGVKGVAPNIKILPLKVLGENGGTVFHAIKAIEYAEAKGVKIANCSWGSDNYSQFLYDAMKQSNMLFVCAAGNDGESFSNYKSYPAAYELDNNISVASLTSDGQLDASSNYGSGVNIAAPGAEIYSTLPENKYGMKSGTSMAAPYVSGAAALILAASPETTAAGIKEQILNGAVAADALKDSVDAGAFLNAGNAVTASVEPVNYLSPLYGAKSLSVRNELYSIGGFDGTSYQSKIIKFNPASNQWESICELPYAAAEISAETYNNCLYLLGGTNENQVQAFYIYDTITGELSANNAANFSIPYAAAHVILGNYLYLFGGLDSNEYSSKVYAYNLENGDWETKADLPFDFANGQAVEVGGAVYLLGGANSRGCMNEIYEYDPVGDRVIFKERMRYPRKDFGAAAINGQIYLFGGSASFTSEGSKSNLLDNSAESMVFIETAIDSIERYNPSENICEIIDSMESATAGISAVEHLGNIYLTGGWDGDYKTDVKKYFGAAYPKNIQVTSDGAVLTIRWGQINGATGYEIELDGEIYTAADTSFSISADGSQEHIIRVRASRNETYSVWSEYIYHYFNSTMLDAKELTFDFSVTDRLYETGQSKWYKISSGQPGKINLTLSDVPENSNYIMQLYNSSGEIISSDPSGISNVVITEYNYYVTVTAIEGEGAVGAYSLSGIFEAAADGNIPDRIKAAFLQPADLDDPSIGSEFPMEEITDDDIADEPDNITDEGYRKTNERDSGGGAMGPYTSGGAEETFYESVEDDPSNDSIQPTSIEKETTAYGSIAESGTWIYRSVTVPANMPSSSSQRLKLVVSVIPEVEGDVFVLRWEGSNTESDNFWYHNIGDSYYLTASLSSSRGQRSYTYQIRYSHGVRGSDGNFTVKTYWIVDDSSSEDFDSRDGVNDNATTAESATDIGRGYKTFTGKIDHPLDHDFYLIYVGNNEKVSASLESPTGKDYCVSIIDHDGRTENVSASAYLDGWYKPGKSYAFASINTGTKYEEYMLVEVYGIDGDYSPDSTYTLTITQNRISASGDLELNDKFIDADDKMSAFTSQYLGTSTKSATAIEFCIDTPTDRDRYAIYLNAGDKISMEMRLPDEYNDSYYQYRLAICSDVVSTSDNVSWKQRTYNNPDSTHSKSAAYIADTAGTYYVSVSSETRKCDMLMDGLLLITKTPASSMDSYEDKGFNCTNDFVFSTLIRLNSTDLGINGATKMSGRISSTFDNELDVDWFEYVNNSSRSKNSLISLMDGASVVDGGGLIVLDANYNLLSDGEEGLVYNLSPYTTYYIGAYVREGGYQRRVTDYTLAVEELPPFSASVSNFKINGDDGAMLGYGNKVSFDLYTSGAVIFPYTIKLSMGWDSGNMFEKASQRISLRDGTQTVEFDDIALTGNGANLKTRVTVILGNAEMHTSQLYRQEVTKVMPSDLMLDKSDGNELYVNNPETITDEDVIYPGQYNNKTNNLIYQQEGITGTNTLYITHSTKEGNEKPSYEFYYDVDFYNPSASPVNITLKRPYAAANDGWDGYINLRELYLERLWDDHETATVTIPAGGHRLLFQDVVPEVFGGAKGFTVRPPHCYVAIFADFTVPKGKEITVSSLAAYSPEYLRLSGDGGQQYAGTDVKLPISGSPFVMSHRDIEDDIYLKMKGRDANGVNTVSANLSYIINDNISDCRLPLYIRDEFYGLDFKNRQEQWIANLNPINDQYDARYYSAPSSLPSYSYDSGDGGTYLFDFQYLNPYAEYTDTYAAPQIGDIRNYPLNNTILNYFRRAALTGVAEPYPSGVEQDYLNDMTMACGSWGVTHKYTLDVTNSGSKWRTLNYHLIMKNFAAILYTVRDAKTGETIEYDGLTLESEAYKTDHDVFRVVLPPGARYTITFSTLNGVGTAGFGNYLELGTIY